MNTIEKLNPLTTPLQGINLIEASAGTGKTYTITTLFIRLILEKHLTVDKILVVTFTEAATDELRDRVRRRLREALTAFQQGDSPDEVLAGLLQLCIDRDEAIFRLTNALRAFDEAAIFTIHSFCRQMLHDNAFESGVLFDAKLVSNQSHLLREIIEDFWRQHFYQISQLFVTYALENGFDNPTSLLSTLKYGQYVGQPFLQIIPQLNAPLTSAKERAFYSAFTEVQAAWASYSAEIEDLLINHENLNKNKYRNNSISEWCKALNRFLEADHLSIMLPEKFIKFTNRELARSTKKNKMPPQHEFFDLCDTLLNCQEALSDNFQQHLLTLKIKLFDVAEQALAQKKRQHHILSFDDLLINLHQALRGGNGEILAKLIRKKFHAALIDEFQDTDPVQYEIFHTIYGTGNPILFLIGDPKQAIYSFRGADIFTYMGACHDATHRYTLATNWRSQADLIGGVNKLFGKTQHPFLFKDIPFQPVDAPPEKPQTRLKIENKYLPPLQIWFVSRELANTAPDKPINKSWAKQQIPYAVGYEIARLLILGQQGQAVIGDKPLFAGAIAVLVRTNTQARQMQKVLTRIHIPSVLYSRESLFTSFEIMEIERVLLAVTDPSNEGLIKAALTTDMLGVSGSELHKLMENDRAWQKCLNRFQHYHYIWRQVGFIQMYRTLLLKELVPPRLLSYPDGERRLTNVLHAAELLQQAVIQQKLGINGLCQWLSQQRSQEGNEGAAEEQQLRLESDEKLVKIVTIHKSKGLEYPIVFCPFVWDGFLHNQGAKQFTFHNENDESTLDLGSTRQEQHRKRALEEERAENLRLFYVAVTRAKHRCYLIYGAFRNASTSALAHLVNPNINVEKADDVTLLESLQNLTVDNTLQISQMPTDRAPYHRKVEQTEQLTFRLFSGAIEKGWKVSSFSSLASTTVSKEAADQPDYDEMTLFRPRDMPPPDKKHIFNFPRGARAGNFMHALFENLDFTQPDDELIENQLTNFGYSVEKWQETIMNLVDNVLNTPLEPQQPDFTLSCISRDKRLNELEFYYPMAEITPNGLETEFGFEHLEFTPVRGFMKGYIDMIFEYQGRYYIVDYKSNLLGTHQDDYEQSKLNAVMLREKYVLQYHIYVVTLHRYLSARLPGYCYKDHFGGVYYLFLRGMNPEAGANFGIYRDHPTADLINRLSSYFQTD